MMNVEIPSILVVDDEPDELRDAIALELEDRANSEVIHPHDVELPHLEKADLVLVDYRLDKWKERDAHSVISLQPANGIALVAVLREHVDQSPKDKLTAFALHSSHLDEIQGRLPTVIAQHVLARLNNLEWAFPKDERRRYEQMVLLADAVRQLPRRWPQNSDDSASEARDLLKMNKDNESFDRCWRDVVECRAPLSELTAGQHGILFIRWLLNQVMPYPCFLWETHWVAVRLGISVDALQQVLEGSSRLAEDLESMRYSGILSTFLGDRWWRGSLEDYVWELAGESEAEEQKLREALTERAGMDLEPIDATPPVVCLDANLQPTGQFLSPMTTVTLHPDHWPAFADPAWMDVETVRDNPHLLSIVDPLDRHRVDDDNE